MSDTHSAEELAPVVFALFNEQVSATIYDPTAAALAAIALPTLHPETRTDRLTGVKNTEFKLPLILDPQRTSRFVKIALDIHADSDFAPPIVAAAKQVAETWETFNS